MVNISATEFKNKLGQYLETSIREPIVVEKSGRPASVLISYAEFQRFIELEDEAWGVRALEAAKEGYLGVDESARLIEKLQDK